MKRGTSGDNTLAGTIDFETDAREYNIDSASGLLTVNSAIVNDCDGARNLNLGGAGNGVIDSNLTYSGSSAVYSLTKRGAGTWTLNGSGNTYNGTTTISGGTLKLGVAAVISSSPLIDVQADSFFDVTAQTGGFTLSSAQTLKGMGTVVGNVTTSTGSILAPGGSAGTLTFNSSGDPHSLTLTGDFSSSTPTVLQYELSNDDEGTNDRIQLYGDLAVTGPTSGDGRINVAVTMTNGYLGTGTYRLIDYMGTPLPAGTENQFRISGLSEYTRQTYEIDTDVAQQVNLVVGGAGVKNLTWTGANGYTWDLVGTFNWKDSLNVSEQFYDIDSVTFDNDGPNASNITLNSAKPGDTLTPGTVAFTNGAGHNYTFDGYSHLNVGANLAQSGAGNVTFSNASNISVGGLVILSGSGNLTFGNTGDLTLSGGLTNSGTGEVTLANTGAASLSGPLALTSGTLTVNRSTATTLSSALNGGGNLRQTGSGVLTLSGDNSGFNGTITVATGATLKAGTSTNVLGSASAVTTLQDGATLDVNAKSIKDIKIVVQGAGVGGMGAIDNMSTTTQDSALKNVNVELAGDVTFGTSSGRWGISGGGITSTVGSCTITKVGSKTIALGNVNVSNDVGDIDIQAGNFQFGGSTTMGDPSKTITIASGASLVFYNTSNPMNKVLVSNGGEITAIGDTTFNGPLTLNAATTIRAENSGDRFTLSNAIGGVGGLSVNLSGDEGTVALTNSANSYQGPTTIASGTLSIGDGGTTGSLGTDNNVVVASPGTLAYNLDLTYAPTHVISGTGKVSYLNSDAVVTLNHDNTYTGDTRIEHGTVVLKSSNGLGDDGATPGTTYVLSYDESVDGQLQIQPASGNLTINDNFNITGSGGGGRFSYSGPGVI